MIFFTQDQILQENEFSNDISTHILLEDDILQTNSNLTENLTKNNILTNILQKNDISS